jgi:hypothetical protein
MEKSLKYPFIGSSCQAPGLEEAGLEGLEIGLSAREALRGIGANKGMVA